MERDGKGWEMKKSELTFLGGFMSDRAQKAEQEGRGVKSFDWDSAACLIKDRFQQHGDLKAEAGLQGDWDYTGGVIFEQGNPVSDDYTYLSSNWAKPTLILSWDGVEQEEVPCFTDECERFAAKSKWDETSIAILGTNL